MKTTNQLVKLKKLVQFVKFVAKTKNNGEATKICTLIELPAVLLKICLHPFGTANGFSRQISNEYLPTLIEPLEEACGLG